MSTEDKNESKAKRAIQPPLIIGAIVAVLAMLLVLVNCSGGSGDSKNASAGGKGGSSSSSAGGKGGSDGKGGKSGPHENGFPITSYDFSNQQVANGTPGLVQPGGLRVEIPQQLQSGAPEYKHSLVKSFDVRPRDIGALDRCATDVWINWRTPTDQAQAEGPLPRAYVKGQNGGVDGNISTPANRIVYRLGIGQGSTVKAVSSPPTSATLKTLDMSQTTDQYTFVDTKDSEVTYVGQCGTQEVYGNGEFDLDFGYDNQALSKPEGAVDDSFASVSLAPTSNGGLILANQHVDGYTSDSTGDWTKG